MIFLTVGTHEQPFNRIIKEIDTLVEKGILNEEVFVQIGFSTYKPKFCKWEKIVGYDEMQRLIKEARIVITHGGPSSFLNVLQYNKVPIVMPRKKEYNEHVNNHQVHFLNEVIKKGYEIIKIENENELGNAIKSYKDTESKFNSNNYEFNRSFHHIVKELMA